MPDPINITQIPAPRVELIDPRTGLMSREWFRFFNNIYTIVGENLGIVQIPNGGTGLSDYPLNGQLLIGNTAGKKYNLNTLTAGSGIGVTNGAGTIGIANTGVLSNVAGTGISVSSATGNVTVANTGVLSFNGGSTGLTPNTATTGAVTLAGTLDVDNGGTGQTSYTNGQLLIGNTTGNTLTKATLTAGTGITITNGTGSISVATNGTVTTTAPVTKTADFSVASTDTWLINNKTGSTCTVTLPSPSANTGRVLYFINYQNQSLVSASSNVVSRAGGAAGTAILDNVAGNWATIVSDGTSWVTTQAATYNNLLLE
jgi:hypothetical protein